MALEQGVWLSVNLCICLRRECGSLHAGVGCVRQRMCVVAGVVTSAEQDMLFDTGGCISHGGSWIYQRK